MYIDMLDVHIIMTLKLTIVCLCEYSYRLVWLFPNISHRYYLLFKEMDRFCEWISTQAEKDQMSGKGKRKVKAICLWHKWNMCLHLSRTYRSSRGHGLREWHCRHTYQTSGQSWTQQASLQWPHIQQQQVTCIVVDSHYYGFRCDYNCGDEGCDIHDLTCGWMAREEVTWIFQWRMAIMIITARHIPVLGKAGGVGNNYKWHW